MLYEKLTGQEDPRVPVHQFMAVVAERHRGALTREDIISIFLLAAEDLTDLDEILDKADSLAADRVFEFGRLLHDILLLSESGLAYGDRTTFFDRVASFT